VINATAAVSQTGNVTATVRTAAARLALFTLFLACGLAVFILGVDYHTRFWTTTSGAFKVGMSALFLVAMLALRRSKRGRVYWPAAFAFFAASLANVTAWYLAEPVQRWLLGLVGVEGWGATPQGLMWTKLVDVVLRLAPIFALVLLAREGLGSLYIRKGNLRWSLGIGVLAMANLLAMAIAVGASNGRDMAVVFSSLPWWSAFALMNGFMEEIWFRGLFLKRVQPAIGAAGAVWLTTLFYASSHLFATYIEPAEALVFGIITFTLGCAWALLMQKTNTLWGSVAFHMAADLYLLIAFGI